MLCDLSERSHRHQDVGRDRRRQHHVGLRFPSSRRHLAGFAGVYSARARPSASRDPAQNRLCQRGQALRVYYWLNGEYDHNGTTMTAETILFVQGIELPPNVGELARTLMPPGFALQTMPPRTRSVDIASAMRNADYLLGFIFHLPDEAY